ncbi:condensation domain-containing protein [Streptomyces roseolus]|uniref:condensation domain-containing protein n=1 Tax=Streptomyces roseolus TaxID=67358 RepID=UPI0037925DD1
MGFVEEEIAQFWSELLGVTTVAPESRFARLGGAADTAARLSDRVDEELGVRVPAEELLGADTLEAMGALVRAAMETPRNRPAPGADPAATGPRPGARDERPVLSFGQQRLWFMQQIDPGTTLYNVPTVLHLRGPLDPAALGAALDALVARHEVLRTTYAAPGGRPYQVVAPPAPVPLPYTDVSGHPEPAAEAGRLADEEARWVFDLAAAPPLRARLVRVADREHRLVLTFHHIAVDGWSLDVLHRELGALYGAATGRTPAPPGPDLQYADYAAWQRARLDGPVLDGLVGHWRAVLGDDPQALAVPTDRPRPASRRFRGAVARRELGPELVGRLRDFCRNERVTPYMAALAGFDALLAGWSGARDVTVGTPVAGRTRPELEHLVGCLINMVPVRVRLDGDPSFRELVAAVRTAVLDASAHQDLPFDKLVEALVTRRTRDFLPVFRVMFSYLRERENPRFPGLDSCIVDLTGPEDTAKYDLSLYAEERGDRLALTLEYDTDLFTPDTPAALLAAYERTLHEAIASPGDPVADPWPVRPGAPGTERSPHRDR